MGHIAMYPMRALPIATRPGTPGQVLHQADDRPSILFRKALVELYQMGGIEPLSFLHGLLRSDHTPPWADSPCFEWLGRLAIWQGLKATRRRRQHRCDVYQPIDRNQKARDFKVVAPLGVCHSHLPR